MSFDKNCFYCSKSEDLDSLMVKICDLEVQIDNYKIVMEIG